MNKNTFFILMIFIIARNEMTGRFVSAIFTDLYDNWFHWVWQMCNSWDQYGTSLTLAWWLNQ